MLGGGGGGGGILGFEFLFLTYEAHIKRKTRVYIYKASTFNIGVLNVNEKNLLKIPFSLLFSKWRETDRNRENKTNRKL